jgi:RNA polymerase sigma-70 factor (ECF subfamily)
VNGQLLASGSFCFAQSLGPTNDVELASAFAARVDGALEEVYRRYGALLRTAARHVLGPAGDTEDCVHDALMRIWSRRSYCSGRGSLRAFLCVCVRNEAISRRRGSSRLATLEQRAASDPLIVDAGDHGVDAAERMTIRAALAALPREQRDVIELAYWGRYTQSEIATKLAVPLGTIKRRASLGLRKLARTLAPQNCTELRV